MDTATFRCIYSAELDRTGSTTRAFNRAVVTYGFLTTIALPAQGTGHLFARATHFRHKATLRRVGLAPIQTPQDLALLGKDLGATDRESLGRLLWTLNTDRRSPDAQKRSLAFAVESGEQFLTDAIDLLADEFAA
jgi:hypothetical protein